MFAFVLPWEFGETKLDILGFVRQKLGRKQHQKNPEKNIITFNDSNVWLFGLWFDFTFPLFVCFSPKVGLSLILGNGRFD